MVFSNMRNALIAIVLLAICNGACGFRQLRIHRAVMLHHAVGTPDINDGIATAPTSISASSIKSLRLFVATSVLGLLALQGAAFAKDNEGTKTDKKFGE
jgi:hypothetical protein